MNTNQLSFEDARAACQQDANTDLVSITDDYEFNFVRSMIYRTIQDGVTSIKQPGAWLGLTVHKNEKGNIKYKWTDDFPFANTYWDTNEPNQNAIPTDPNAKAAVVMNLPYGNWAVMNSLTARLPSVCKTNMDNIDPNNIPDNRGDPLDCADGWSTFSTTSHHCYKPFQANVDWFTAEGNCQKLTGHLLSIHSETKNAHAKALFNTVDEGAMWIGAKRNDVNGFIWQDGSVFSYTRWGNGEPTGEWDDVPEDCATIERDSYWNDDVCANTNGYMCQIARPMSNCIGKTLH